MKITKNMVYRETTESRELFLSITNDGDFYRSAIEYTIKTLQKKHTKGLYKSDLAITAWYNVATAYSKIYNRKFGYNFTVQERYTVAVELEKYFKEDIEG